MSKMWILGITLVVMLASIFLISSGTNSNNTGMWWAGILMIGVGGIIPPLTRFIFNGKEE